MPPLTPFSRTCLALGVSQALLQPVNAAVITVDTPNGAKVADGYCSLSEAIYSAYGETGSYIDSCTPGDVPGMDTIVLQQDAIITLNTTFKPKNGLPWIYSPITIEGNNATIQRGVPGPQRIMLVKTGELVLNDVTISGGFLDGTLKGAGLFCDSTMTLSNVTVVGNTAAAGGGIYSRGTLIVNNSSITGNSATWVDGGGGGIRARLSGSLSVMNGSVISGNWSNGNGGGIRLGGDQVAHGISYASIHGSTLADNHAKYGAGIHARYVDTLVVSESVLTGNSAKFGGGIHVRDNTSLTVSHSTLSDNYAREGAGIYVRDVDPGITVENSVLTGNHAYYAGGAIHVYDAFNTGAVHLVSHSTLSSNTANYGGGIGVRDANKQRVSVHVMHSTLSGNRANWGGGFLLSAGVLDFENSTLSGNYSWLLGGGGWAADGGDLSLKSSTITGNSSGILGGGIGSSMLEDLVLVNNLVSGNRATNFGGEVHDLGSTVTSTGNLFGDDGASYLTAFSGGFYPAATDFIATWDDGTSLTTLDAPLDQILAPLADNGGPTLTHGLVPGSPARDVVSVDCPLVDQRDIERDISDGFCDIGAFDGLSEQESCFVINAGSGKVVIFCL